MSEHNLLAEIARVALLWCVGSLAALAEIFNREKIPDTRHAIGRVMGGGFAALVFGAVLSYVYPALKEDIVFMSGAAAFSGFVGLPYFLSMIKGFINRKIESESLTQDAAKAAKPVGKTHADEHENDFSIETRNMFDSGKWTLEELRQMKADYMAKKRRAEEIINKLQNSKQHIDNNE